MAETQNIATAEEGKALAGDLTGADKVNTEKVHKSRFRKTEAWAKTAKRVPVRVPRVMGDQTVFINGYMFQIKAGETVQVPEEVARILERAERI